METKTERWTLRVTPSEAAIVQRVVADSGVSLSEYVVRHAVAAASADLADRRVFTLDTAAWQRLHEILDRPSSPKPRLAALMDEPSVLDE